MPATLLSPSRQYFGRVPSTPPAMTVLAIRVGMKNGLDYRLADDPDHLLVRVVDDRVTIDTKASEEVNVEAGLELGSTDLQGLARILAAWRSERGAFAAYAGTGTSFRHLGYSRFMYYAPNAWKPTEISANDPRLPGFQEAANELRVRKAASGMMFAVHSPVVHDLVSGRDELVGRVIRGPGNACVVLSRGAVLVSVRWPRKPAAFGAVARLVVRRTFESGRAGLDYLDVGAVLVDPASAIVIESAAEDSQRTGKGL